MTQSELEQLKKMTRTDIARKYVQLLSSGKINGKTYQWLIDQGRPADAGPPEPPDAPTASGNSAGATGHHDGPHRANGGNVDATEAFVQAVFAPRSQKDRVLSVLADGRLHSTREIADLAYGIIDEKEGICRIAGRVDELRHLEGYNIPRSIKIRGGLYGYILLPGTFQTLVTLTPEEIAKYVEDFVRREKSTHTTYSNGVRTRSYSMIRTT